MCKHRGYGCNICDDEKKKSHLTEASDRFRCNSKSKYFVASERGKYLSQTITSETGELGKFMINMPRKMAHFDKKILY